MDLAPANIPDADRPLRRKVAMAYRSAREADRSHHKAYEAAMLVYLDERPGADRLAASGAVSAMIASAINADPEWFWRGVKARMGEAR